MKRLRMAIAAGIIVFGLTVCIGNTPVFSSEASSLDQVKQLINEKYPFKYDDKATDSGAAAGFVSGIGDPYSQYFTAKEAEEFVADVNQALTGIGVRIEHNDMGAKVVSVMAGSPALDAGISRGDVINVVDSVSVAGKTIDQISTLIRGDVGSKVTVGVLKYNQSGNNFTKKDYTLTRRDIDVPHVEYELLPGNIALISINTFGDRTVAEFDDALAKAAKAQASSMIVDLRGDGGGYLDAAVDIAGWFTDGPAVYLAYKDKDMAPQMSGNHPNISMPIAVLVNDGTASASEVLAACIQDSGKKLIGTKTFGKGVVQQMFPLNSGDYIKLTVASFYSPLKHPIQKVGLTPNEYVSVPDMQLARAVSSVTGKQLKELTISPNGQDLKTNITGDKLLELSDAVRSDSSGVWYPLPDMIEAFGGAFNPGINLQINTADPLASKPISADFIFAGTTYSFDVSNGVWKDSAGKTMPGKLKIDDMQLYANQQALEALGLNIVPVSSGGYQVTEQAKTALSVKKAS